MARAHYKTQQRELLLSCLQANAGRHMTVEDILRELQKDDQPIGQTTIYRNLDKLVEAGAVRKYIMAGIAGACYQYAPDEGASEYFHLQCEGCGTLVHLRCGTLDKLQQHVLAAHAFQINALKTVLYGKCPQCLRQNT